MTGTFDVLRLWQYKPPLYLFRFYATLRGFVPIGVGLSTPLIHNS
jgi:hypothetical protein